MSWKFLDTRCHELLKVETNSNTSIAKTLIKEFKLNANMDTIRMYVSKQRRLLNLGEVKSYNSNSLERIQELYKQGMKSIEEIGKLLPYTTSVQSVTNKDLKSESESSTNHINPTIPQSELLNNSKPPQLNSTGKYTPIVGTPEDNKRSIARKLEEGFKELYNSKPQLHLILGCIHVPFHNKILLDKIEQFISDNRDSIKSINIIGDFIDCFNLSGYSEGIKTALPNYTIYDEYNDGLILLGRIIHRAKCKVNFIEGNHEQRVYKYNADLQKAKTPVPTFEQYATDKSNLFKEYVNWNKEVIKVGSYELIHGIYFNEYPSKKHLNVFRKNMVFAHTHRIGNAIESNIQVHNIGWLGNIESNGFSYANPGMKQTWRNGFGILVIDGKNEYFHQITCDNNSFYFNGKSY